jgi:hypothetical protein
MNPQELKSVHAAAGQIETALQALENLLEETNNQFLFKSTGALVLALRFIHDFDGGILSIENQARMAALALADKPKGGRNSFTTGF